MVVDASPTQPQVESQPRSGRIAMVVAGVVALATSALLAVSWIDTGEDATCSSVVHPGTWWGTSNCGAVMSSRSVVVVLLAVAGGALLVLAARRRPRSTRAGAVAAGLVVLVSLVALAVNERVRSDGLL
jgi:hypothetical protein